LEEKFRKVCSDENLTYGYETTTLRFTPIPKIKRYTPDWEIAENVFIETKGRWTADDRSRLLAVIEQHPEVKIYIIFQKPHNLLSKTSGTTYGDWCNKKKIEWCDFNDTEVWLGWIRKAQGKA
jgi:hypothetical protein